MANNLKNEIWKEVKGTNGKYKVSSFGRVIGAYGKLVKPVPTPKGYVRVKIWYGSTYRTRMVHRIVAEAFIPKPDGKTQINHIDGDKTNNRIDNLEWCTQSENMRHRIDVLGIKPTSSKGAKVKCVETGEVFRSTAEAARSVGLSRSGIGAALRKSYTTSFREGKWKSYQSKTAGGYHWEYV